MTLLFLALWLQMSAPQLGAPLFTSEPSVISSADGSIQIGGFPLEDIVNRQIDDQAADETDGQPPLKVCNIGEPNCGPPPAEPVDVPAVQETRTYKTGTFTFTQAPGCAGRGDCEIVSGTPDTATEEITTCADKSRILEHDENSPPKYWCRKVEF